MIILDAKQKGDLAHEILDCVNRGFEITVRLDIVRICRLYRGRVFSASCAMETIAQAKSPQIVFQQMHSQINGAINDAEAQSMAHSDERL